MTFTKEKVDNLTGGVEWRYTEKESEFRIIADRGGIRFEGRSSEIPDRKKMDQFAQAVGAAWNDHLRLIPKISTNLSGH